MLQRIVKLSLRCFDWFCARHAKSSGPGPPAAPSRSSEQELADTWPSLTDDLTPLDNVWHRVHLVHPFDFRFALEDQEHQLVFLSKFWQSERNRTGWTSLSELEDSAEWTSTIRDNSDKM